jgi:hypothetical protein
MLGSFQLIIPAGDHAVPHPLLARRQLSVLRQIAAGIPVEEQWHAVFNRYLDRSRQARGSTATPTA